MKVHGHSNICKICESADIVEKVEFKHIFRNKNGCRLTLYNYKYVHCNNCKNDVLDEDTEKRINEAGEKIRKMNEHT